MIGPAAMSCVLPSSRVSGWQPDWRMGPANAREKLMHACLAGMQAGRRADTELLVQMALQHSMA